MVQRRTAKGLMSALGQKLPRLTQSGVSALPPKAAAEITDWRVRFVPEADSCTAAKTNSIDHLILR